ncbi:nitroreductase family protein [Fodinisporobacter ferrooxydans]|uniref:Nitroreductase family protein n=1 Tax=Fodinisporobacter ferrooxydans TaxID=2901836 RepID=A0ABY4CJQ3_9BACL|nr:nitroreductase family protein [Alicyclobacillaceae bacterium MYW30-H2]
MDVLSAITYRREISKFKTEPLSEDAVRQVLQAAYLSPKGNNLPSCEFILVTNRQTLDSLETTTPYMKWLQTAPASIVIAANPQLSKYWLQDASIAGGYIWLAATSLGLGAAWGAVYHAEDAAESASRESHVRALLHIPESLRVVAILGFGQPDMVPKEKDMYPIEQVIHREIYRNP